VVICGVIVAGLGVLNDVTITQASAVWELADSDPDQKRLFSKAMRIGRDHIASTVYTIAFATAGASLPVLLLIAIYNRPLFEVLQTESFAAELIRTMVGSIGLILAVPLTTAVGVAVVRASGKARLPGFRRRPTAAPAAATSGAARAGAAQIDKAEAADATVIEGPPTKGSMAKASVARVLASEGSAAEVDDESGRPAETQTEATETAATTETSADRVDEATSADDSAAGAPEAAGTEDEAKGSETPAAPPRQTRLRRRRRSADDDLDFSDLRDPD